MIHASRWASGHINELKLRIYGDRGGLEIVSTGGAKVIRDPTYSWLRASLSEDMKRGSWQDIPVDPMPLIYDHFVDAIRSGENSEPSFRTATRLQQILDASFAAQRQKTTGINAC